MSINYFSIVSREWKKVIVIAVLSSLAATALSFIRPLEYGSTIRLLVIQRSSLGLDPYTAIKSAESISGNLASIIYTTSFFDKVISAGFNIDQTRFSAVEQKRRKQWKRMVDTQVSRDSGLLSVTVYNSDRVQSEQIANAIGSVLQQEGWTYVGGGDLQVKIVDTPLTSRYPVRPNIPVNGFGGFVLGLIGGVGYIVWLTRENPMHRERNFLHEIG